MITIGLLSLWLEIIKFFILFLQFKQFFWITLWSNNPLNYPIGWVSLISQSRASTFPISFSSGPTLGKSRKFDILFLSNNRSLLNSQDYPTFGGHCMSLSVPVYLVSGICPSMSGIWHMYLSLHVWYLIYVPVPACLVSNICTCLCMSGI